MKVLVRSYRPQDLGQVLQLWQQRPSSLAADWLTLDEAVDLVHAEQRLALVAEADPDGRIVGAVVAAAWSVVGCICRLDVLANGADTGEIADRLLAELEETLAQSGVRKLIVMAGGDSSAEAQLLRRGYRPAEGRCLERELVARVTPPASALAEVGGRMISPGLWEELRGMDRPKQVIENRVILPLAEPELAERHGVVPPRAIVLFGPPGTGKTSFAKGIASRLGWPFVEIQPAALAAEGAQRQAKLLAETLERVLSLAAAVMFVDEVEDLASMRQEERRVSPSITNEFLKQIPRLRDAPHHLLVCATNWVRRLDPAFLRPGRFDYVLPVGPPDEAARRAIWQRYIDEITDEQIEVDLLVAASERFTPADIEFAAREAAQRAFEREHFEGTPYRARSADFLEAIRDTRPTLTSEMVAEFLEDTDRFARF
jgi:transitional endoplasmic reticulum ATPase